MLHKVLFGPVHKGQTLNVILQRFTGMIYPTLIDLISSYHNLNLDEKSSYLTTFSCSFGRYRYTRLPFGSAPVGDMFWKKTDELFSDMASLMIF